MSHEAPLIDWTNLAANAFWIIGCALALATVSYARWEARLHGEQLRVWLREPRLRAPLHLGCALFGLGLAARSASWVETSLWCVLMGLSGFRVASIVIALRRQASAPEPAIRQPASEPIDQGKVGLRTKPGQGFPPDQGRVGGSCGDG